MPFQLTQTHIRVEGNDEDIIFSNLAINQKLADVNSFHFTWRQPEGESSLSAHVSFYNDHLSKEVTITINDEFTFKGIIYAITCNNQDTLGVSYEIAGKGLFAKLDQVPECNSFYKKNLTNIFNAVNTASGTTLNLSPANTSELFYTVQYNQTTFAFMRMLAARYGEWLYYDGTELVLKAPDGDAITITQGQDVHHVDISAKLVRAPRNNVAFDRYSGDEITHQPESPSNSGFIAAAVDAGDNAFGSDQASTHIPAAATSQVLSDVGTLSQNAAAASAVVLRATGNNSSLKLGSKIKLIDEGGHEAGEYYVTEVHHACATDTNYQNQFVAIPAEVVVPPYTNPLVFPVCNAQPAKVAENEDADGLDRVKVHFPWQGSEDNTPWLNVITPHAGTNKGIRFLPEIGEEILVGFLDNNAERPYVIGAIHTDQNKSGEDHEGNYVKVIGTKTGRRLFIDEHDDRGQFFMMDNFTDEYPKNLFALTRKNDNSQNGTQVVLESINDRNNLSVIALNNSQSLKIGLMENGALVGEILLENEGPKITIKSVGDIDITAEGDVNISAANIKMEASSELKMDGQGGAKLHGSTVKIEADSTMDVKGVNTTVEGSAKADFKAGAMASLTGAIVKIN